MDKDILIAAKHIGKPETFGLTEPFHTRRFERCITDHFGINVVEIGKASAFDSLGRINAQHLDGLNAALGILRENRNTGAIGNGALSEVPKHICMKQNIWPAFIGDYKPKSLHGIKPFHLTVYFAGAVI